MIFKFRKVCEGNLFGGGDFFSIFAFKLFPDFGGFNISVR